MDILKRRFGVLGVVLSRMGRGEDDSLVRALTETDGEVKSVGHSATLAEDVQDPDVLRRILLTLSEMVGRRARRYGCSGRRVSVTVRYHDFTTFSRQLSLDRPAWTSGEIYRASLRVLDRLELTEPIRLLGVSLGGLQFGQRQAALLPEETRHEALQRAVDRVNDRYGEFVLGSANLVHDLRGHRIISPAWRGKGIRDSTS